MKTKKLEATTVNKEKTGTYLGLTAEKKKPTKKHRPAIWEMMLGTVYGMNDRGEVKYFDYDYETAIKFSGYTPERNPRVYKAEKGRTFKEGMIIIKKGQIVLYIE